MVVRVRTANTNSHVKRPASGSCPRPYIQRTRHERFIEQSRQMPRPEENMRRVAASMVLSRQLSRETRTESKYSTRMRRSREFLLTLASFALFGMQATGTHLHAHVGEHDDGATHGPHLEQAYSVHHADDDAHTDVSVVDSAPRWYSKIDVYAAPAAMPAYVATPSTRTYHRLPAPVPAASRFVRLRPQLRAPPPLSE